MLARRFLPQFAGVVQGRLRHRFSEFLNPFIQEKALGRSDYRLFVG